MKPFYFLIFSFIFISSFSLSLTQQIIFVPLPSSEVVAKEEAKEEYLPPLPILKGSASAPTFSAQSALAIDVDSRVVLFEKNADLTLLPASTTKIVTALVALDYFPTNFVIEVKKVKTEGQKMNLVEGEKITVGDLLYGLLIFSANDAAEVLAQNYPGGRESFIKAMNMKARELHLNNTFFNNPSGLDTDSHLTTARDLTRVAIFAMENPFFRKTVGTKEITVKSTDERFSHKLVNLNELVGKVDGVLGVKTGWTENARENLVTYLERDSKKIMIVVLASQDRFGESTKLIDWIIENYEWQKLP